jgi:lipoprotein-anchoring transpeptidase ErfK/SrfK
MPDLGSLPTINTDSTDASTPVVAAAARATLKPKNGAKDVGPNDPVTVTVFSSKLDEVVLKGDDGTEIAGKISADKTSWTSTERLDYATKYTYSGTATDTQGAKVPVSGSFTTIKPAKLMGVQVNIPEGGKVGVAAPIIITFLGQVGNRAAVESALTVTTSQGDKLEGNWGWMQDEDFQSFGYKQSQVHWRPTKSTFGGSTPYWPAGTQVTVTAKLKGVNFGGGIWGKEDFTRKFSIRPDARVTKADVSTMRLVVTVNGQVIKNYPVSYGKESEPGRATTNGIHIVTSKYPTYKMTNPQFGYYNVPKSWAVRINNNGEFIHENMEAKDFFGKQNVSHGCVNMSDFDAKDFYDQSLYGDPVEITNASGPMMTEKDYIYDWIYSPDKWKQLSAIG